MRKLLAGSIVLVALAAAPALAADMSVTKTPVAKEPPFVVYTWNGFYVGLQGGGGWSHVVQTDPRPFNSDAYQPNGGVIGGELGFNVQYNHLVVGLEADGSGSWIKGYTIGTDPLAGNCGGVPQRCFSNLESFATFRGRAGFALDNVLPYLTGGLAVGWVKGQGGHFSDTGALCRRANTLAGRV